MDDLESLVGSILHPSRDDGLAAQAPPAPQTEWDDLVGSIVDPRRQEKQLAAARVAARGREQSLGERVVRSSLPVVSTIAGALEDQQYKEARKRFEEGTAGHDEAGIVAAYERRQEEERGRSTAGKVLSGVLGVPAVAGEFAMTGGIGPGASLAGRVGAAAARTAAAPSMYLPAASQRSVEQGGEVTDPKNLAPAFALGLLNTTVLQRVGSFGGSVADPAARLAAKTGAGMAQQAGVDVVAGAVDEVLPDAYKMKTRYGLVGNLIRGEKGELAQGAAVQAATFAAFAALHGNKRQAEQVMTTFAETLDAQAKAGMPLDRAVEVAKKSIAELAPEVTKPDERSEKSAPRSLEERTYETPTDSPTNGRRSVESPQDAQDAPQTAPAQEPVQATTEAAAEAPVVAVTPEWVEEMRLRLQAVGLNAGKWSAKKVEAEAKRLSLDQFTERQGGGDTIPPGEGTQFPQGGNTIPERRQDLARRKAVAEMGPEELRKELLTSPLTGLPNRRAFDEAPPAKAVAMSDADGLKAFNDKFGYDAGNALLKAKAEALQAAGLDAYHEKGDEYLYRGDSPEEIRTKLERARQILKESVIEVTLADGTVRRFQGADFSYGVGHDLRQSETGLKGHKAEREARGERARGELRGITELGPQTGQVDQGRAGPERARPPEAARPAVESGAPFGTPELQKPAEKPQLADLKARFEAGEPVELDEAFAAAGLSAREQHVLRQRLTGRSYEDIASDPEMGKRLTRQRIEQIEKGARAKLGIDQSVAKAVHEAERAERGLEMVERGGRVGYEEIHADPETVNKRINRRVPKWEREHERLVKEFLEDKERAKRQGLNPRLVDEIAREGREDPGSQVEDRPAQSVPGEPAPQADRDAERAADRAELARLSAEKQAREAPKPKPKPKTPFQREWDRRATEAGVDPEELHARAAQVLAVERGYRADVGLVEKTVLGSVSQKIKRGVRRERIEDEFSGRDELAGHLERLAPEQIRAGESAEDAVSRMIREGNEPDKAGDVYERVLRDMETELVQKQQAGREVGEEVGEEPARAETAEEFFQENVPFTGVPLHLTFLDDLINKGFPLAKAARKWLTSKGDLPESAFQANVEREGKIAAFAQDVLNAEKDLRRAMTANYASVDPQNVKQMDDALRGDGQAFAALPERIKPVIQAMRDQVDALSRELIRSGAVEGGMAARVDENMGVYLTRQYRVFSDPKWAENVPEEVRNRFKSWLKLENPSYTPEQLEAVTKSLLYDGTAAESPIAFLHKSKLGSKDLSILQRRKDVPDELRALWGEFEDPLVNYANSVAKMSHLLANHQFLTKVREQGLGTYLTPEPAGDNIVRIAGEGSEVMKPLNGLYTTPEIKKAFEEIYAPQAGTALGKLYMRALGLTKYAKTVGSHVTHIRNLLGNAGFAVANGHWQVDKALPAVKALADDTAQGRAYWRELLERGVVGEGIDAGEIRSLVKDVLGERDDKALTPLNMMSERSLARFARKGLNLAEKAYHHEDAVWKIYAFENEVSRYQKAHPDWSAEQVRSRAAEIVRNTYPTYSMVPKAVKGARRLPFVAPFVSFPSEVVRTTYQTMKLAAQEMADPATRSIGATRLAGVTAALTASMGLAAATRAMFGVDKEDEDALRRFAPEWSKNAPMLHLGTNAKGERRYIDLGQSDPHAYLLEPVIALLRGEDPQQALLAAARPFVAEELLSQRVLDVARNTKKAGGPVYNPQAPALDKLAAAGKHLGEPFVPGSVTSGRRLVMSLEGTPEPKTGRVYDPKDEAMSNLTGQRVQSVNVGESLGFKARAFDRGRADVMRLLTDVARRRGMVADQDLAGAYRTMEGQRKQLYEEMRQDVLAAQKLGMDRRQLTGVLKNAGVSEDDVRDLLAGRYRPFRPDAEFLQERSRWVRQETDLTPEERRRRARLVREAAR